MELSIEQVLKYFKNYKHVETFPIWLLQYKKSSILNFIFLYSTDFVSNAPNKYIHVGCDCVKHMYNKRVGKCIGGESTNTDCGTSDHLLPEKVNLNTNIVLFGDYVLNEIHENKKIHSNFVQKLLNVSHVPNTTPEKKFTPIADFIKDYSLMANIDILDYLVLLFMKKIAPLLEIERLLPPVLRSNDRSVNVTKYTMLDTITIMSKFYKNANSLPTRIFDKCSFVLPIVIDSVLDTTGYTFSSDCVYYKASEDHRNFIVSKGLKSINVYDSFGFFVQYEIGINIPSYSTVQVMVCGGSNYMQQTITITDVFVYKSKNVLDLNYLDRLSLVHSHVKISEPSNNTNDEIVYYYKRYNIPQIPETVQLLLLNSVVVRNFEHNQLGYRKLNIGSVVGENIFLSYKYSKYRAVFLLEDGFLKAWDGQAMVPVLNISHLKFNTSKKYNLVTVYFNSKNEILKIKQNFEESICEVCSLWI